MTQKPEVQYDAKELLEDFREYCIAHPQQRFWQALRNWCGYGFILASQSKDDIQLARDTFYWKSRQGIREQQS